jgi:hypothetical protein
MASGPSSSPDLSLELEPDEPRFVLRFGEQEFALGATDVLIGRGEGCNVVVDEPLVSRRHARISVDGAEAYIEDLDSANGTFVNHARLHGRARLFPGDQVFIGASEMELLDDRDVDRPTMPVPEPSPVGVMASPDTPSLVPSSKQRRHPGNPTIPIAVDTGVARDLEHAGRLADKMFSMGRIDAAAKILEEPLAAVLAVARDRRGPDGATVDMGGRYALKLAAETLDGKWLDVAIELHAIHARPLREETMQQLAALRARASIGDDRLLARYVDTLRSNAAQFTNAERILCERLACLLPSPESKR